MVMMQDQKEKLWAQKKDKVLIAAHRGTCGGNVIQNTCLAYENALQHGADLIEVDAVMSIDGIFFAFHNGHEKSIMGVDKDIRTMYAKEIERFPCRNQLDIFVDQHTERLSVILERFKGRCLINIDRAWFYWKEIIQFLDEYHMEDQIILKSPAEATYLEQLEASGSSVMYMPIIRTREEWELVQKYSVNVAAAELIFEDLDHSIVQPEFIESLHQEGIMLWANALTLHDDVTLSAMLDDNRAIMNGYDTAWGRLIQMGFDIIQTDWPALMKKYITE